MASSGGERLMLLAVAGTLFGFYVAIVLLALLASVSKAAPIKAPLERTAAGPAHNPAATYSNDVEGNSAAFDECNNGWDRRRAG